MAMEEQVAQLLLVLYYLPQAVLVVPAVKD
jgi:hypothetical protein